MKVRRLTYASNGTTSATFYYDGKNRQIARNVNKAGNNVVRFSAWDNWELVEEYGSGLAVATGYLQESTGVIKSWSAANTIYYYQDKLSSTTHVADASGQLLESYHYDLYGTPSYFSSTSQPLNSSTVGVTDLYAGERWIPELALYDLRNRFMSPELGRFLQADPIGFKGDASNLYRYCGNDPVDRSDPSGLYGRAAGEWTDKDWEKYRMNQERAIDKDQRAKDALDHARENGRDESSRSTIKAFQKKYGPSTKETMAKVSNDLGKKLAALRDDGSNGYFAHPATDRDIAAKGKDHNKVPAYTYLLDKNIWVNVGHGWSNYVLEWAIDHEAGHSAADLRDLGYKVDAWRYNAISNPTRLRNADSATDFVHEVTGR
jgi:RHS repeat-associated protein